MYIQVNLLSMYTCNIKSQWCKSTSIYANQGSGVKKLAVVRVGEEGTKDSGPREQAVAGI